MTPALRSAAKLVVVVAVACSSGGCVYGVRGGAETLVYSGGPVITQATATGSAGFGSTNRDARNNGIAETITVGAGGDARNGGAALSLLGGLEWFDVPDQAPRRWGYRVGIDAGGRLRGADLARAELLVQARGGPVLRLGQRASTGDALYSLAIEATVGMAASLDDPLPANDTSFVGGVAVTLGALHVAPFHF